MRFSSVSKARLKGWMTGTLMVIVSLATLAATELPTLRGAIASNPTIQAQAQPTVASPSTNPFEQELLRLTNAERARAGLPPLRLAAKLSQAAQRHAEDMVRNRFFSHTGSDGSTLVDRARAVGYNYSMVGENIAAGGATPAATMRQWMNSPGHRQNILNRRFTEIGFGYVSAPSDRYRHYWVQVFGTPRQ